MHKQFYADKQGPSYELPPVYSKKAMALDFVGFTIFMLAILWGIPMVYYAITGNYIQF